MATETLNIDAINATWAGASGAATDIDEPIASADGNLYGPGPQGDDADFGFTNPSVITDGDTVTNVSITVRLKKGGTAGNEQCFVSFRISGSTRGGAPKTDNLTTSFVDYGPFNDAGWNSDWTLAELQSAEIRLQPSRSGMPGTNAVDLDCADMVVTYTSGGTTYFETLAATALGTATLGRTTTFVETLAATVIGVAALSTLTTWFRTLSATAVGVATLLRKTSIALGATALGSATLAAATLYTQALVATASGIAGLSTLTTWFRTLGATTVGVATLVRKTSKTLGATAIGTATLLRKTIKTLAATALAPATLVAATLYTRTLTATALGLATLDTIFTFGRTMTATALGIAGLSTMTTWARTLAATAVGVAGLTKGMFVTLGTTAVGAATLLKKTSKTLAASAVGSASLAAVGLYEQGLAAVALGVATLNAAYTAAGPVVINTWRWLAMRLGI